MRVEDFRCSTSTRARGDALGGSATAVAAVLMMEDPGPYGYTAWLDARLPAGLGAEVIARGKVAGVRPQLIRRGDRPVDARRRVFVAYAGADGPAWLESAVVSDPREVLDLDLAALARGQSVGLTSWTDPVLLVCTHGKHDRCCAERGRPVYAAAADAAPDLAWQTSHLGGDRYSGNLLALVGGSHLGGLMFGELDPETTPGVVRDLAAGRLPLASMRGRTCWPKPVQAAEVLLRTQLGLTGLGGVDLAAYELDGQATDATVDFTVAAAADPEAGLVRGPAHWRVRVVAHASEPVRLSCHKDDLEPAVSWRLGQLDRVA